MAQPPPGPGGSPPDEQMEEGDPHAHSAKKSRATKRSFADAVASLNTTTSEESSRVADNIWAFEDPEVESDSEVDVREMGDTRPRVTFSKELRKELCSAWKMALIIKYLGKSIHFNVLNQRLPAIWNLQGKMTLIDLGYGCFVARFDNKNDYLHALIDGPWKIFGNYLVTQRWVPEFRPRTAKLSKMAVWIRIPDLPMEYFRDDAIRDIAENVGKPLKLDRTTIIAAKGKFARIAVEIDLSKPLVSEVWVGNYLQTVEYEGLHVICFSCGVVGHREQSCPDSKQNVPETPNVEQTQNTMPEAACMQHAVPATSPVQNQTTVPTAPVQERRPYGTWMMVTNKKKSVPVAKNQHHSKINGNAAPKRGNQFEALKDLQGAETQPTIPISSEKSKSKSGTAQRDKGKSPATFNPLPERLNGSSIQPLNRTIPDSVTALNSSSRGRGGRQGATRDKGRGSGRVFNAQGRSNGRGSTSVEWRDQMSTLGVFQFGGSQPPAGNQMGDYPSQTGFAPGVANGRVRKHVKQLLITSKADVLCLLEIKSSRVGKMVDLVYNLGFNNHFVVEPLGFAGGLLLFWKQGLIDLDIIDHNSQAIHTKVNRQPESCFVTFAYVRPNFLAKCRFWEYCKTLSSNTQGPWIVLGDFNDIASSEEQWGSTSINPNLLQRFTEAYGVCNLLDPGLSGSKFTWYRFVGNRVVQMRKLDRVFWNMEAQLTFPEAKIVVLPRLYSDHNPIMFIEEAGRPPERSVRPIRFEAAWLNREDYKTIWKEATEGGVRPMDEIITMVAQKSSQWNRQVFGNIFRRKKDLETRIQKIQRRVNFATSNDLQQLERHLITDFNEVLDQEEAFWFQKSRMDWIKDGDRNTRFYHNSALIRRNRNRIRFLKVNGAWTDDAHTLSNHITDFFSSLFCRCDVADESTLIPVPQTHIISSTQAAWLIHPASLDEVRKATFGIKKYGSPGPDGIQAVFYQHFWNEVGPSLTNMVNQALTDHLLNVAFKVISKVLVNRLRPIMCNLIGPHQNSFLPGRSTMDNVILTQEVVHSMNTKRGKKGSMIVKIDLQKAYDSVSWSFLEKTLDSFGFPRQIIELLLFSLRESDISVLWNGGCLPAFKPGRGLRQGDPLAPYLFNIVMERLAYDIQSKVTAGCWKPIKISRGGIGISHLFFADDLMLFGEATERQAKIMIDCLNTFSSTSGLQVNLSKSTIFCSPNLHAGLRKQIGDKMNIPTSDNLGTYLGIPMLQKRVSRHTFSSVVEKMRKKLATWKASTLNMAGRRILVQSSLASVPTYTMQALALPVSTCNDVDKICRNFLWGHTDNTKKIHTVNWSHICRPRQMGGLGLRTARDFNMAFLTKMAWQIFTNQDRLWVKVLREKYVKQDDFLHIPQCSNASWGWRGILKGRNILAKGLKWCVGDGTAINFWHDWWTGKKPLITATNTHDAGQHEPTTVSAFIDNQRNWDIQALSNLLPPSTINDIRAVPLPAANQQVDKLTWPHSNSGLVSVSSAFSFISGHDDSDNSYAWIWKLPCVEKVKLFIWKIMENGLLTNSERRRRGLLEAATCPSCGTNDETIDHLFRSCDVAVNCWEAAAPPTAFMYSFHLPVTVWMEKSCASNQTNGRGISWRLIFPYILWNMWKGRNNQVFNNVCTNGNAIVKIAEQEASEAQRFLLPHAGPLRARQLWIPWSPPQPGFVKMNSDGAMKANSGMASAGGLLRDHMGNWIVGFSTNIGHTNSFLAELWGFREGLVIAKNRGYNHIIAETDSEAVVQVLINDRAVGPFDFTLLADCKSLIHQFQECRIMHTFREGNQCADHLANIGQSITSGTTWWDHPPAELTELLNRDAWGVTYCRWH
uniref:LINE-type retrotransposon LIb DNA n=1 Tax=Ipomoea batatas TaxID=4120 RepID=A0A0F6NGC7_IPOBA|nr:LINE-type retrotransposon LIb DNA [Ipomoea batatas]